MVIFQGSRGGPTFSRGGGVELFPGGVQLLNPYRNPLTVIFQERGEYGPPVPSLDPHLRESHPLCRLKNPTVILIWFETCRLSTCNPECTKKVHLPIILEKGSGSI